MNAPVSLFESASGAPRVFLAVHANPLALAGSIYPEAPAPTARESGTDRGAFVLDDPEMRAWFRAALRFCADGGHDRVAVHQAIFRRFGICPPVEWRNWHPGHTLEPLTPRDLRILQQAAEERARTVAKSLRRQEHAKQRRAARKAARRGVSRGR